MGAQTGEACCSGRSLLAASPFELEFAGALTPSLGSGGTAYQCEGVSHLTLSTPLCVCVCAQSCPTLCDPMDCSLPGSSVRGGFQARILEWVAIPFSRGSS